MAQKENRTLYTPECILSYPHLFKPQPAMQQGGKEKYSAALIITKEQQETEQYKLMKADVKRVLVEEFGDQLDDLARAGKLRLPFRDNWAEKGYPEGSVYINVRTERKPQIVSIYADPETGKPALITDEAQIYPGCIVVATLRAFAYDVSGNKGASFALNNLQKIRDGERLDGRQNAEDEFDASEEVEQMAQTAGASEGEDPLAGLGGL